MYWTTAPMLEALWDLDGKPQVSSKKAVTRHWLLKESPTLKLWTNSKQHVQYGMYDF